MQPLGALDRETARALRGIFCDIDDTLTCAGHLVPEAYTALCRAAAAGLRVVPVTGRPLGWAEVLAALWPVCAVIGEGGAAAALPAGEWLWWDDDATRQAHETLRAALVADVCERLPWVRLSRDQTLRRVDVAFDIGEHQRLTPTQVSELCAFIEGRGARSQVSTVHAHGIFSDYDKAGMAVRVGRECWAESVDTLRTRYLFVGDSPNDQAGFTFFTWTVGVANVRRYADQLAPPPRLVTTREGGYGFAELVEHVLALRALGEGAR